MTRADEVLRILREDFGITTEQQLNEAIRKQGFINLAPFCTPPKDGEENTE